MSASLDLIQQAVQQRLNTEIFPSAVFYGLASPIFLMLLGGTVALMLSVFSSRDPEAPSLKAYGVSIISAMTAAIMAFANSRMFPTPHAYLGSGFLSDSISHFAMGVVASGTLFTFVSAYFTNMGRNLLRPELSALLQYVAAGLMIMVSAGEFVSFFAGLEIASVSLYILVGYQRRDGRALESAVKYFILGSAASGIILMGMALIYLNTGSLKWSDFAALNLGAGHVFAILGAILFFCGLSFKLAMAPFHSWAPDVYQGAHSTLTGFMASMVKFSMAMVFIRTLGSLATGSPHLTTLFWVLATASIIVGSLFGLVHNSIKRMLAYSSIANAGYFGLGFATLASNPASVTARQALVGYSVTYAILVLGTFAVLAWLEEGNREDLLKEELSSLGQRHPAPALMLTIFIFGLAGIPPLAGFFGKLWLINSSVQAGLVRLPIIMVIFSAISLWYYLAVLVEIWFKPKTVRSISLTPSKEVNFGMKSLGILVVLVSLVIGIFGPRFAFQLDYSTALEAPSSVKVVEKP